MLSKKSIFTFGKAQLSAFIGGISDWIIMLVCVEILSVHYTVSIWISGFLGAMVNFSLNKYWTYGATQESLTNQLLKFYLVVVGSVALKSFGTWLMTEGLTVDYKLSRLVVDLVVSLGYNFTMQKYWVFRKQKRDEFQTEETAYQIERHEYQEA